MTRESNSLKERFYWYGFDGKCLGLRILNDSYVITGVLMESVSKSEHDMFMNLFGYDTYATIFLIP